jgi:hypothetical protein
VKIDKYTVRFYLIVGSVFAIGMLIVGLKNGWS